MPLKLWRRPLDSYKIKYPHGKVHIIDDRCKECGFCIEFCPKKVLDKSTKFNAKGYHPPIVKDEEACVSCGLCEIICPDFAIFNTPIDEKKDTVKEQEKKQSCCGVDGDKNNNDNKRGEQR